MKTSLYIMPALAIVGLLISFIFKTSYPDNLWLFYTSLGVSCGVLVLWFLLDWQGIKSSFKKKNAKFRIVSSVAMALGFAVAVGVCSISVRPRFSKSFDATKRGIYSLSEQSIKIVQLLKEKKEPVTIEGYFINPEAEMSFKDSLQKYDNAGLEYTYTLINPQADPIKAQANGIKLVDTVLMKLGSRSVTIVNYTEEKITNAFLKLYQAKDKTVCYLSGHGEPPLKAEEAASFYVADSLIRGESYLTKTVSLLEKGDSIDSCDLVIYGGASYDLKDSEVDILSRYLDKGGSMLSMVDALSPVTNINKLLKKYGIEYNDDLFILASNDPRVLKVGQLSAFVRDFDTMSPITSTLSKNKNNFLVWPLTRSLKISQDSSSAITPLAKNSPEVVRVKNVKSKKDLKTTGMSTENGSFDVMAVAVKKIESKVNKAKTESTDVKSSESSESSSKEARIVVTGSSSYASSMVLGNSHEGMDLFMNAVNYLLDDVDFISIRPKDEHLSTISIGSSFDNWLQNFLAFLFPLLFALVSILFWLIRRQK